MNRSRHPLMALIVAWGWWLLWTIAPAATVATAAWAQTGLAGTIDTSFGDNTLQPGRVLTDFRALASGIRSLSQLTAMLLQPDGKVVVAGYSNSPNGDINFALVRYNANGTIDTSFGDNTQQPGRVLTDFAALASGSRSTDVVNALLLQPDGKIVAGGYSNSPNGADFNFALVRYNANGTLDTSFGDNIQQPGRVLTDFRALADGSRSGEMIQALALQPDGKIIAAGWSSSPNIDLNFALVRYNPNGTLDTGFGDSTQQPGRVLTDFGPLPDGSRSNDEIAAVVLQPDGKIIAGGYSLSPNGDKNFALVRYNANGTLDTSFGDNTQQPGRVLTDFRALPAGSRSTEMIQALVLQPDGKIVAAGSSNSPNEDSNFALVRYNPNGTIDTSFGDNTQQPGRLLTDFRALPDGSRSTEILAALVLQPDGKIVAGGYSNSPNGVDYNFALVRYNGNGTLDTSFGDNTQQPGRVLTDFAGGSDVLRALALQPDGKIVAAGFSASPSGNYNFALVRYYATAPAGSTPGTTPGTTQPPPSTPTGKIDLTLTLSAPQIKGGVTLMGTITLSGPAPAGGLKLLLDTYDYDVVLIPYQLTVPAGARSASFPITTSPVAATTVVGIYVAFADPNASFAGELGGADLTITP